MIITIKISLSLTATNQALVCPYHDISGQGQLRLAWTDQRNSSLHPIITIISVLSTHLSLVTRGHDHGDSLLISVWLFI